MLLQVSDEGNAVIYLVGLKAGEIEAAARFGGEGFAGEVDELG